MRRFTLFTLKHHFVTREFIFLLWFCFRFVCRGWSWIVIVCKRVSVEQARQSCSTLANLFSSNQKEKRERWSKGVGGFFLSLRRIYTTRRGRFTKSHLTSSREIVTCPFCSPTSTIFVSLFACSPNIFISLSLSLVFLYSFLPPRRSRRFDLTTSCFVEGDNFLLNT